MTVSHSKTIESEKQYSVLISVYYKEDPNHLKESLDSMINQTLIPNQIVLIQDGSLTETLEETIQSYQTSYYDLFTVVPLKENVGLGRALDIGMEYCHNELVARMDSDDISLQERCEKQVQSFLNDPNLSIVGTMVDEFYDDPENIVSSRNVPTKHHDIVKFMRRRSPFNHTSVMFKKSEVIRCGGYGSFRKKQDLDLFSRMINYKCKAANINESLVLFRSNENNFKRRKSWSYCKSYIDVQFVIWKRGHCSIIDLAYVTIGQIVMYISPMWFLKWLTKHYLRSN